MSQWSSITDSNTGSLLINDLLTGPITVSLHFVDYTLQDVLFDINRYLITNINI